MELIRSHFVEAEKQTDRCKIVRQYCEFSDCPLRKLGKCIHLEIFKSCVYGKTNHDIGPTKRTKSYNDFRKTAESDLPKLSGYSDDEGMAYVGDYVYLPYTFITVKNSDYSFIPVINHSAVFGGNGSQFMKRESFTAHMVVEILKYRPQAFFGGEIPDYQKIHMPRFACDLARVDPDLYQAAKAIYPEIDAIAARGEKRPLPIWQLGSFTGSVLIDGKPAFWYGNHAKMKIDAVPGVPSVGKVDVDFTPTKETMCVIVDDADHIKAQERISR
jgi:hypothetical protein